MASQPWQIVIYFLYGQIIALASKIFLIIRRDGDRLNWSVAARRPIYRLRAILKSRISCIIDQKYGILYVGVDLDGSGTIEINEFL